jgi:hypothetical protein
MRRVVQNVIAGVMHHDENAIRGKALQPLLRGLPR